MSVRDQEGRGGVRQEGRRRLGFTWRTGSGGQAWAAALHPPCRGNGEKREHNSLTVGDRPGTTRRTHTATRRHRIYCREIRVRGGSPSAWPRQPQKPPWAGSRPRELTLPRSSSSLTPSLPGTPGPGSAPARHHLSLPRDSSSGLPRPRLGSSRQKQTRGSGRPSNSPTPQATSGLHRGASEPLEPTHRGLSGPRGGRHRWPSRLRCLCLPGET